MDRLLTEASAISFLTESKATTLSSIMPQGLQCAMATLQREPGLMHMDSLQFVILYQTRRMHLIQLFAKQDHAALLPTPELLHVPTVHTAVPCAHMSHQELYSIKDI